ncbi:helix-turn-helix domain-containing protein [Paenibacillus sp. LMG 31458]|uniref:Helix-turn-helix domain-containing protein n=1 Tax=Paenibacillus phytorum TaxID=2654977 RepID=A0ABX1XTC2_9BACL|nr:AraC family transcriptional regulator [Paenibacillus phytorum]NOU71772.1 helix-turn-helix domain-containing protein [Paenibacillus phytorum]
MKSGEIGAESIPGWDQSGSSFSILSNRLPVINSVAYSANGQKGDKNLIHGHKEDWVTEAVEFFQLHYTEQLSIERVARMAGVHRSHFTLTFTQRMGLSPQQYVQQLRMDRAKQLLYDHSLTVSEISQSVGYPDLYAFSRAFKKHIGCSPSEYRSKDKECGRSCS